MGVGVLSGQLGAEIAIIHEVDELHKEQPVTKQSREYSGKSDEEAPKAIQ